MNAAAARADGPFERAATIVDVRMRRAQAVVAGLGFGAAQTADVVAAYDRIVAMMGTTPAARIPANDPLAPLGGIEVEAPGPLEKLVVRNPNIAQIYTTPTGEPHTITVRDRIIALGYTPTKRLAWNVGDKVSAAYIRMTGREPPKPLQRKANGKGSHCIAIYPASFSDAIDAIVHTCARGAPHQMRFEFV